MGPAPFGVTKQINLTAKVSIIFELQSIIENFFAKNIQKCLSEPL
jgi:hypothetical protein